MPTSFLAQSVRSTRWSTSERYALETSTCLVKYGAVYRANAGNTKLKQTVDKDATTRIICIIWKNIPD